VALLVEVTILGIEILLLLAVVLLADFLVAGNLVLVCDDHSSIPHTMISTPLPSGLLDSTRDVLRVTDDAEVVFAALSIVHVQVLFTSYIWLATEQPPGFRSVIRTVGVVVDVAIWPCRSAIVGPPIFSDALKRVLLIQVATITIFTT